MSTTGEQTADRTDSGVKAPAIFALISLFADFAAGVGFFLEGPIGLITTCGLTAAVGGLAGIWSLRTKPVDFVVLAFALASAVGAGTIGALVNSALHNPSPPPPGPQATVTVFITPTPTPTPSPTPSGSSPSPAADTPVDTFLSKLPRDEIETTQDSGVVSTGKFYMKKEEYLQSIYNTFDAIGDSESITITPHGEYKRLIVTAGSPDDGLATTEFEFAVYDGNDRLLAPKMRSERDRPVEFDVPIEGRTIIRLEATLADGSRTSYSQYFKAVWGNARLRS